MPIFNAKTLEIDGAECLIRCPALADIKAGPDEFVTVAEKQLDIENRYVGNRNGD